MTPRESQTGEKEGERFMTEKADKIKLSLLCYIKNDHEKFEIHE